MSKLKITKGRNFTVKSSDFEEAEDGWYYIVGNTVNGWGQWVADAKSASIIDGTIEEAQANAELIADAFNIANETQLLPSELKEQRDELLKALNIANAMITYVGCVQGCNKGTTHDGEQCQWCDESSLIKNTINKIKDNE